MAAMNGHFPGGLAKMANDYLRMELNKDVQRSNWELSKLSDQQINYAAKDALAGIKLFNFFAPKRLKLSQNGNSHDRVNEYCSKYLNSYYNHSHTLEIYNTYHLQKLNSLQFKLMVLDSYHNDVHCKGNESATARKYAINRKNIRRWVKDEIELQTQLHQIQKKTKTTSATN